MSDGMKRLEELTERLSELPDSEAPPIPEEWLRASKDKKQVRKEGEVKDE